MELWIWLSVAAAAAQTMRFALQKVLASTTLSPAAATWARFLYSAPIITFAVLVYSAASGAAPPTFAPTFWWFAAIGGITQILATVCTIALFKSRAFAVGITFKKTEVMMTALVGWLVLGDQISSLGALFIAVGFVGVLLLSDPPEGGGFFNKSVGLGLLSGVFFAVSAVGYRGATLAVSTDDLFLVAGGTLACVTVFQTLILGVWLWLLEPGQIMATLTAWKTSAAVGVFSLIGSWCWFAAFSLHNAAYVFAVGQVELIFSILVGLFFFKERLSWRELLGIGVLPASILAIAMIGSL